MEENEKIFDVKEAADYLKCSQSTIRKLLRNKAIPKNDNIKVTKKGNIKTTNIGYFFDV